MHYLVDGYNLLFRLIKSRSRSLEKKREQLITELNDLIRAFHLSVSLIFDGAQDDLPHPIKGHFDALEIIYSQRGQTADDYIIDEVERSRHPEQLTVVSNDRELTGRCRQLGSKGMHLEEFISFLLQKRKKKRVKARRTEDAFRDSEAEIARLLVAFEQRLKQSSD